MKRSIQWCNILNDRSFHYSSSSRSSSGTISKTYRTSDLIRSRKDTSEKTTCSSLALIVLNSGFVHKQIFDKVWQRSSFRVCADGGANFLYEERKDGLKVPDVIKGDLDSVRADVLRYYKDECGVKIIKDEDQNANDFTK